MLTDLTFEVMWIYPVLTMAIGIGAGYLAHMALVRAQAGGDQKKAHSLLVEAEQHVAAIREKAEMEARDLQLRLRERFEEETSERRTEIREQQKRVEKREANADRRMALLDRKEATAEQKAEQSERRESELAAEAEALTKSRAEVRDTLARAANLPPEEAHAELLVHLETECRNEASSLIRSIQNEARETAAEKARDILVTAIERYASGHVTEVTTAAVRLPSEEMKGRIIGRDGRNIRSLEMVTGCTILIDDTPGMAVVSAFDPIRREVARITLERLIEDGRIHPVRIEEITSAVRAEVDSLIQAAGEEAVHELSLTDVAPELVRTVGMLRFRQSYTQNVLRHSIEVAHLMGMMASELGLDPAVARRVGLFHDIGKAVDHEIEGGHAEIGADLLRRHGESDGVVEAVGAHHHEAETESPYAPLAAAADAVTAARPGARNENVELYLNRLSQIEAVASGCKGVRQCYAVQAGRELRVLVAPDAIDDAGLALLAREISRRLVEEVRFPGQIRVTVIRETRSVEYAR